MDILLPCIFNRRARPGGGMELTFDDLTRRQLVIDLRILSLCLRNHYGPEDLERITYQLAQLNAVADAKTSEEAF